ncbi:MULTISPECIES: Crp/Fnr family transcriptional regulator [unclassified Brevundimonas]|uniref:Crp/Fnr family transcriptional regulator n=1 Tax=unclassified Brevundimonas TaxID=2622653 RepID=UPI000E9E58D4|nr:MULTISPECIES: Crp/Fnr family transcriptional regulator [unclassified Brevundimonas]MCK6104231.1 Crp/Fnr family transcriptional regulator [Brevundimonas sp. EYE_349]HBI20085.1 cyclic nucleotide-binding protein [Brevundimonas sp.]
MIDPFIRKLEHGADLTDDDRAELRAAVQDVCAFKAGEDVSPQGDVPRNVHVVLEGWGCRYKLLDGGQRQVMAIFVPGDMCDLHVQILTEMDHGIGVLTNAKVAQITPASINRLTENPRINLAFNWATLADEGTLREWLVNIGQRPADQRLAHLICELHVRLGAIGAADPDGLEMPLTQTQLADMTAMSPVHVNRTLMALRGENLIQTAGRYVRIPNVERLAAFAGFDPSYLHLRGTKPNAKV